MAEISLISVKEALKIVQKTTIDLHIEAIPLKNCIGRILAEDIYADRDFPPFDRVMMDGIAIDYASYKNGNRNFAISEIQYAGEQQKKLVDIESCLEVMTGAIIPSNADTVIPYEHVEINDGTAYIKSKEVIKGQHIHQKASDRRKGDCIINKGVKITPAEIGGLATVGKAEVKVYQNPLVAIISTGDELVDIDALPADHQIRKSNSWSLWSALYSLGINADLFHLEDTKDEIKEKLKNILVNYDVLMLSGGVSKGKKDFIPEVLNELGVEALFHRIAQRPGKPFFFGNKKNKVVFGFPGNPVSAIVCYYKYFVSWYKANFSQQDDPEFACLKTDFEFKPELTNFLQVKLSNDEDGRVWAEPVPGHGSGDLANLLDCDGFIELPANKSSFIKGSCYPLMRFRF